MYKSYRRVSFYFKKKNCLIFNIFKFMRFIIGTITIICNLFTMNVVIKRHEYKSNEMSNDLGSLDNQDIAFITPRWIPSK